MICPACQADNREGRRFCARCGASLPAVCAACGFANDARDTFCGGCGAPLSPDAAPAAKPAAPAGERRQVTILFADLVGFTRLTGELGAEAAHLLVSRYLATVDEVVSAHGGTVEYIGDAAMAMFGAPVAHGDDPLRAMRAAAAIHAAMPGLGIEAGRALQVHIGIASGEVVAAGLGADRKAKYTVIGESVNLAARLDSLAGPGETLISDAVFRSVGGQFDCQSAGEISLKGFDQPVRAWRVLGEAAASEPQFDTPFVGRQAELRQFHGLAEVCRDASTGRLVLLRGEAGMGKTRLAAACTEAARSLGFRVHRALVLDFGAGKGQDAIRALVRSLLDLPAAADKSARATAIESAVAAGAITGDQRVFLNDMLNLPQPVESRALYDAMDSATRTRGRDGVVTGLARAAAARSPLLVLIEDVHWADQPTMANLAALARSLVDEPILLIMSTRIDGDPVDAAWRLRIGACPVTAIELGPLRAADATALAAAFAGRAEAVIRQCIARAEGNPLFLEQLLRNAAEDSGEIPGSIQSLVQARLDRLEARDKRALQAAAVIGQRFSMAAVAALTGEAGYDCAALLRHRLIRPEGADYLFAHALIREGVYGSLLAAGRRELHRKAADWIGSGDPGLRAQHLDRADDPGAAAAYLEAARLQLAAYYGDKALELIERGLAVAGSDRDRCELLVAQGELLLEMGRTDRAAEAARAALAIAPSDALRCRALIGLAAVDRILDRYDDALEWLLHAQSIATEQNLKQDLARIHYMRGNLHFPRGQYEHCLREHEQALLYARDVGSVEAEARALGGLGDAAYARGHMLTARRHFEDCVELARRHGFGRIEVANLPMVAICMTSALDLPGALRVARSAMAMAARVGDKRSEMIANHIAHDAHFRMGAIEDSRSSAERSLALARELKARRFECEGLGFVARVANAQGRRDLALELVQQALAIGRETAMQYFGPWILGLLASITADGKARRESLAEAESILRDGALSHNHLQFYPLAMRIALADGDWGEAERYAAALQDYTRGEPLPLSDFEISRGRALAAIGRGRRDATVKRELEGLIAAAERARLMPPLEGLRAALAGLASP
jgi:class 3 adenylate cyclase/tetratricopeptide (TPR) repeat protein